LVGIIQAVGIPPTAVSDKQLLSGKDIGLSNSSNLSQNDTQKGSFYENILDIITDSHTGQKYMKDRVIVRFKSQKNAVSSISQEKIRSAHAKVGATIEKDLSVGSLTGLQLVQLPNGTDVESVVKIYESNPDVLYAEPDYVITILLDQTGSIINNVNSATVLSLPNDPFFSEQWSLNNSGQIGGTPGADINAKGAWDISTGSDSIVVAVIDTGVLYTHSDLSSNIWDNMGEIPDNGIDDDHNGFIDDVRGWNFVTNTSDPIDDNHHGTHVSGTIGAVGNNAIGVAGVNWHVQIMPLKTFNSGGSGSTSDAIEAVRYANANGALVISISWGGSMYSQSLKDAIDASPAVIVCAAGNSESNNDIHPVYPASYNSTNIISVAATDNNDLLASFSNFGLNSVDLAAPGMNILSTFLDGNYAYMSGTSMATPHVSGVAALIKAVNPSLTSEQIKNIILSTVDVKSSLSGKVASGGRLNAYKAILASNPLIAKFIGTPGNGTTPLTVLFTDTSTGSTPTTWNWSFRNVTGNNTQVFFSTLQNPTYVFGVGNYSIVLNASNSAVYNLSTQVTFINVSAMTAPIKIGVYKDGSWYLDTNGDGAFNTGDSVNSFGLPGWTSVIGDWNGLGKTGIGVYKDGAWYLDYNGNGKFDTGDSVYSFGLPGWTSVVGDWNGLGKTEIGVYKDGVWYLDTNGNGKFDTGDSVYSFGLPGWTSVVGDWNGLGKTEIGVYKDGVWYLDMNGDGKFDTGDSVYSFGLLGWTSVVGKWS
jgi:subtilisin family serine protease